MTPVEGLYAMLKRTQALKGYYFNKDRDRALDLLAGLLVNRDRYGYMCCPCRLASGDREGDRDIICPCAYREADIREFGSCYCNLYVTPDWNEGKCPVLYVPERRSPDKFRY
jgi:ferredoxin-thioredoxin reductase catalytic chain